MAKWMAVMSVQLDFTKINLVRTTVKSVKSENIRTQMGRHTVYRARVVVLPRRQVHLLFYSVFVLTINLTMVRHV